MKAVGTPLSETTSSDTGFNIQCVPLLTPCAVPVTAISGVYLSVHREVQGSRPSRDLHCVVE